MSTTQWWLRLMRRYISVSGKQLSKTELSICMWTCMWDWLGGCSTGRSNAQDHDWLDSQSEITGSEASFGRQCKHWGENDHPLRVEKLMFHQGAIYHHHTVASMLEEVMHFVVPMAHQVTAMNGCHRDARHQGQQQMLYLLQDWFWWDSCHADAEGN